MRYLSRRHWRHARSATAALEFAILVVPFLVLALGTFEVGYDFFIEAVLDNAVHTAARTVQVGTAQGAASGSSVATWVASAVCPALHGLLACSQLYVSVVAIPSGTGQTYYTYIAENPPSLTGTTGASDSVCTGTGGQLMLLRAFYLSPTFLGLLVPQWSQASPVNSTARVHVSFASAGFVNEYFSGGKSGC
jgi:Flp pilus assembly protein TadG